MEYTHDSPYNFVRAGNNEAAQQRRERKALADKLRRQERAELKLAQNALQLVYA